MVSKQDFRALVNDYGAQVLSTAMRILGNSEKAQDVHQEVFLAAAATEIRHKHRPSG